MLVKGQKIKCKLAPGYGKWYVGKSYKIAKIIENEVLIRDEKNERQNFTLDKNSNYYVGNYFEIAVMEGGDVG